MILRWIAVLFARLLILLDADEGPAGRHRGSGRGPWAHSSRHHERFGARPATLLVQWLIQERQGLRMAFDDFARLQHWKEEQEWLTTRMAGGGW